MLHATTPKMEDEEMEFDRWNYSVLEELQRKIKENQINFDILRNLARKPLTPNDPSKKKPFSFKKKAFYWERVLTIIQIIALNKHFAFPVYLC